MIYKIIDKISNTCVNSIVWTGSDWIPPMDTDVIQSDEINIGDSVAQINGSWEKVSE